MKFNHYLGVTAASWLLAMLVIAAELYSPFKDILKATFGHHWIGKVVLVAAAFIAFGLLVKEKKTIWGQPANKFAWNSVRGSLIVILLFYILEFII